MYFDMSNFVWIFVYFDGVLNAIEKLKQLEMSGETSIM